MTDQRAKLEKLIQISEAQKQQLNIPPRKLKSDESGYILLNPNNPFDREWYENDEAYDDLI